MCTCDLYFQGLLVCEQYSKSIHDFNIKSASSSDPLDSSKADEVGSWSFTTELPSTKLLIGKRSEPGYRK